MADIREKIERYSIPEPNSGCWLWVGGLAGDGYGSVRVRGIGMRPAHRASYEAFVAPIPKGLFLDHLCRVRCCVNPGHLEPVTNSENMSRSPLVGRYERRPTAACHAGHLFDEANTYRAPDGRRRCRTCRQGQERTRGRRVRIRCDEEAS